MGEQKILMPIVRGIKSVTKHPEQFRYTKLTKDNFYLPTSFRNPVIPLSFAEITSLANSNINENKRYLEVANSVCYSLDKNVRFAISEIKKRGNNPDMYKKIVERVEEVITLIANGIGFDLYHKPTEEELEGAKLLCGNIFEGGYNEESERETNSIVEMTAVIQYENNHPYHYIYVAFQHIAYYVMIEERNAIYEHNLLEELFNDSPTSGATAYPTLSDRGIYYFPLTNYIGAPAKTISFVMSNKQPFGGVKIEWVGSRKGDALLLRDTLGFTLKQINDCFRFKNGKELKSSDKPKLENDDLRNILQSLKIMRG